MIALLAPTGARSVPAKSCPMSAGRDLSCEPALTLGAPATADAGPKRLPALTAVVAVRDTDAPCVCERSGYDARTHGECFLLVEVAMETAKLSEDVQQTARVIQDSLALGIGRRFNGSLNVTHQEPRDDSGRADQGLFLPGRPRDEVSASASLEAGRGRLFYDFTYVGPNFIDRPNTPSEALPARYLHDAGYRMRLRPGLEATIEVKNLGDERTYDYARYPLPGRSYHARVSWEF